MVQTLKGSLLIAGLLAVLTIAWLVGEVAWTVRQLRPHLEVTLENIDRTVIVAGAAAGDLEQGSRAWKKASEQQASETTAAMRNVNADAARLSSFISRTDVSVNSMLLPALAVALDRQDTALLANQSKLGTNLDGLKTVAEALERTIQDADAQISSPDIKASLDNLSASSKNMATGMANLAGVTLDAKQAADYELAQLKKPASVWLGVLKFVLSYGSDARVLFTGGIK